jgi:hypothetical protein
VFSVTTFGQARRLGEAIDAMREAAADKGLQVEFVPER